MLPTNDKERKALPIFTFLTQYFPDVVVELTKLCVKGNIQHNPHLAPHDIKWAREKSSDQLNTAFRHLFDHACGVKCDSDGVYHLAKAIWRLSAELQLTIEATRGAVGSGTLSGGGLVGDLTKADIAAGFMPDHSPRSFGCPLHGLLICKVCGHKSPNLPEAL